ncbi:exopolyphosphatase PRUNE1 isoform X1 [Calypte anna]|uniref:exopolyphosphatase PRUNE1 isoform X1 n=2 Tax=Calypte anna TaxID=9244 RepID=UPI0011C3AD69|nr:exopolyphosphatase PRUNE1 isoform X1 [Calypte anna]XP_030320977.1 exopolyphosphatase PRUNE1 isoform X1 [Calypte anna]
MERFVAGNRAALQDHIQRHQEVHVVMGNEACDLDSTVSALALAYFLAKTSPAPATTFIPVLNIPRAELPLRTEAVFLLGEQGIPPTSLICRDEIDLGGLHTAGLLSLTLVDHHVLPSTDAALEEAVVEVLDHRPLDRDRAPRCPLTVAPVGSCATLVTERIAQGPPGVLDRVTAALLHGTILLDCINLSPAAGKATPRDVACVSLLEERFPDLPARDKVFEALQAAKFDVSGLTTEQMLRKDLKVLSADDLLLPISGIYVDLETFLRRPGFLQDLEAFCQAQGYAGLVAMTISFNQQLEPSRQLAVYSPRQTLRSAVCRALEEASEPALNLRPLPSPWSCLAAYTQGNAWASRKKVLPILRAALGGSSGGAGGVLEEEVVPPPTPMNSLVEECPLAQPVPPLCPQDVLERVSRIAAGQPPGSPK